MGYRLLLLCLIGILGACSDKQGRAAGPSSAQPKAAASPRIEAIRLSRSGCFGPCPIYDIEVTADDTVKFVGDRNVQQLGFHQGKAVPGGFRHLLEAMEQTHFASLRSRYRYEQDGCGSTMTDQPTATFTVSTAGGQKVVSYYYGCLELPEAVKLKALADLIDSVGRSKQWVGSDGAL